MGPPLRKFFFAVCFFMKEILAQILSKHLKNIHEVPPEVIQIEHPRVKEHGDFSTNIAMVLAKQLRRSPVEIAESLATSLRSEKMFDKIEVKGGFLNLILNPTAYHQALNSLWSSQHQFQVINIGKGKSILIEYVSANPTGPMHVGHGRNAVVGDCLARLMEAVGFKVTREFYVNDHGVQIKTLGHSGIHYHSVLTKIHGIDVALPDDVYRGPYLENLVEKMRDQIEPIRNDPMAVGKLLGVELLEQVKADLFQLGIIFDHYFSESSLYSNGEIQEVLQILQQKGFLYEDQGALWFKTTEFGDDKDRVLVKSDNSYTYFTPDIAYHHDKFSRNFDRYINVMGADHGGYVQRIKAAVSALGFDPEKLEFLLMQLVNLKRGGEVVSMSKRTGDYVTLSEVVDEVGKDAARFFFVMRSHHSTLDFDLELAKQQTMDNPVYYIQYAYARIASIFRKVAEAGYTYQEEELRSDLESLTLPEEIDLVKVVLEYSDILVAAAKLHEPHRIVFYLNDLAKVFQNYYTRGKSDSRYRVITTERKQTLAKLFLIKTVQEVFRHGLNILGVSAPEKMIREEEE